MVCPVPFVLIVPGVLFAAAIWVLLPFYLRVGMKIDEARSKPTGTGLLKVCAIVRLILIGGVGSLAWQEYERAVGFMEANARSLPSFNSAYGLAFLAGIATVILANSLFIFSRRHALLAAGSVLELPIGLLFLAVSPMIGVPLLIVSLTSLRMSEPAWRADVLNASRLALAAAIVQVVLAIGTLSGLLFICNDISYRLMRDGDEFASDGTILMLLVMVLGSLLTFANGALIFSPYKRTLAAGSVFEGAFGLLFVIWLDWGIALVFIIASVVSFGLSRGWLPRGGSGSSDESLLADEAGQKS